MRRWVGFVLVVVAAASFLPRVCGQEADAKYRPVIEALRPWIAAEVRAKDLPALTIALVDDQTVVWAEGFGDPRHMAGPNTVVRVGSVSKPFTALLVMLLVEMGLLDIDAPIQDYLPEFQPTNKSGKKLTLRQIMAHRSGLVREPPVGNYFDDSGATLEATVKSLIRTELVYEPEAKTSYSNAAVAVAGYVAERQLKERFEVAMQKRILEPLGMNDSSFDPPTRLRHRMPKAVMWNYWGREFPAPTWDFGMGPAGSLYSTANDQAKLLTFLFARGKTPSGQQLLRPETLEQMWTPQFVKKGEKSGFGHGFFVSEFEGKRRIGHGGAVYGYATELAALPDDKLGVIVCSARDVSNGVTRRLANGALRCLLASRAGKPMPTLETATPLEAAQAKQWAGVYKSGDKLMELYERGGRLWAIPPRDGLKVELRQQGSAFVVDDPQAFGAKLDLKDKSFRWLKDSYERVDPATPKTVQESWVGLIGEYGPDHNTMYILERNGVLHALIEWVFLYPLTEVSANVFKFPDYGLYHGDKLVFTRDSKGVATEVDAASIVMKRRALPKAGETFKIRPVRPIEEIRKAALADTPPRENNALLRKSELVDLATLEPSLKFDIRYATANNFLGTPVYPVAKAYLQKPAAEALVRVHRSLESQGFGLLIHDAYRPWHVTKIFWDATPDAYRHFVANPMNGSRHNRGCAVDLTLFDRKSGQPIEMPGGYDEFTDRSYPDYLGGTSLQRWHRDLLRRAMEAEGFQVFEAEWWHFDYRDWRQYGIGNQPLEKP